MKYLVNLGELPAHREVTCIRRVIPTIFCATTITHPNVITMICERENPRFSNRSHFQMSLCIMEDVMLKQYWWHLVHFISTYNPE